VGGQLLLRRRPRGGRLLRDRYAGSFVRRRPPPLCGFLAPRGTGSRCSTASLNPAPCYACSILRATAARCSAASLSPAPCYAFSVPRGTAARCSATSLSPAPCYACSALRGSAALCIATCLSVCSCVCYSAAVRCRADPPQHCTVARLSCCRSLRSRPCCSAARAGSPPHRSPCACGPPPLSCMLQLLNRQIGVVNFAPLKAHFLSIYTGAHAALPTLPSVPAVDVAVTRNPIDGPPPGAFPFQVSFPISACVKGFCQFFLRCAASLCQFTVSVVCVCVFCCEQLVPPCQRLC
jgi:hypothetical protein